MHNTLWQPALTLALLAATALTIWLCGERRQKAGSCLIVVSLFVSLGIMAIMARDVIGGEVKSVTYSLLPPFGLTFRIDLLSFALVLLFHFCGIILSLYLISYPLKGSCRRFRTVFLLIVTCATGVVMAGDLLSLFLFFEVMSISFFILVIHDRTEKAAAASMKFLYMTIGGSVLYFMALAVVFAQSGSVGWETVNLQAGGLTTLAFIGFAAAFGMKAGLFPLHLWMADAYGEAPTPAMALSSLIMLKTGAYGMIRITHQIFGVELVRQEGLAAVIAVLAVGSILYGSLNAFAQDDLPRRLAYSGMAQLGYILLGIALLNPDALVGGLFHILAHIMMKGTLILCAGAIWVKTGKRKISELAGIGYKLPFTMLCFALASLTAVGLPPMNIFITKWYLSLGALAAGMPLLIVVLLISSVLNAAYYLPIVFTAFYGEKNRNLHAKLTWDRLPLTMAAAIVVLAVGCIAFSLLPENIPLAWAQSITAGLFQ